MSIIMAQSMGAITDTQSSVQMFIELHAAFGEAVAPGGWGDLPASGTELGTVIVTHDSFMMQREDAVELITGVGDESGPLLGRRDGPGSVMERDPGMLQEDIGRLQRGVPGQSQLLGEPSLPGFPESFHAASGLGRVGGDRLNAQLPQGALNLGRARRLLGPMGAAPRAGRHKMACAIGI